ncbi:hypothetical protein JCM10207_009188, partial [Rhodosporidiobolus poonsookiae]
MPLRSPPTSSTSPSSPSHPLDPPTPTPVSPLPPPDKAQLTSERVPFLSSARRTMSESAEAGGAMARRFSRATLLSLPSPSALSRSGSEASLTPLGDTAKAIQAGAIGGAYGPYPRHSSLSSSSIYSSPERRDSHVSSDVAINLLSRHTSISTPDLASPSSSRLDLPRVPYAYHPSSLSGSKPLVPGQLVEVFDTHDPPSHDMASLTAAGGALLWGTAALRRSQVGIESSAFARDADESSLFEGKEFDDWLHEPDEEMDSWQGRRSFKRASWPELADTVSLAVIILVIVGLFAGWPV